MKTLQFKDAKAKLSAVVDDAVAGEPTVITRHGKEEAVVISIESYQRLSKRPSFADLLLAYPGGLEDMEEFRSSPVRDIDL